MISVQAVIIFPDDRIALARSGFQTPAVTNSDSSARGFDESFLPECALCHQPGALSSRKSSANPSLFIRRSATAIIAS